MKDKFSTQFYELEGNRKELIARLKKQDDAILNTKPGPSSWSVAQVIQHLIAADEGTLLYLTKKTQDTSRSSKSGLKSVTRYLMLKFAFVLPIKFSVPSGLKSDYEAYATLHSLEVRWDAVGKKTIGLLSSLTDEDFDKELWRHPLAGTMNLFQMLAFTQIHLDRHTEQIDKTLLKVLSQNL